MTLLHNRYHDLHHEKKKEKKVKSQKVRQIKSVLFK